MTRKRQDELAAQQLEELKLTETDANASHDIQNSNEIAAAGVAGQETSNERQQTASLSGIGSQSETATTSESGSKDQQDCRIQLESRTQMTDMYKSH